MSSIIALIISIIGCFLMGDATILKPTQITIAFLLTLVGAGTTIYSLAKKDYKKICIAISIIACIISIIMYILLNQKMN